MNLTLLNAISKLLPLMVTGTPATPMLGVKLAIVGARAPPTTKAVLLLVVPPVIATLIGPVVAPAGTVVMILVLLEAMTLATVWLNVTRFLFAKALKPLPEMVTGVPSEPPLGVKSMMASCVAELRTMERMLPAAS